MKRGTQSKPKHIGIANLARTDEFITRYYTGTTCHYHQKLPRNEEVPFPPHLGSPTPTWTAHSLRRDRFTWCSAQRRPWRWTDNTRRSAIGWTGHCGSHAGTLPPTRNDDDDDDLILDRFMSALAMGGLLFGWETLLHGRLCDNHTLPSTSNDDDDDDLILVRHDGSMVMMRSGRPRPTGGDTIAPAIKIGLHDGFSVGMILANVRRRHNHHDGRLTDDGMMARFVFVSGQLALGMLLVDQDGQRQTYGLLRAMVYLVAGFGNFVIMAGWWPVRGTMYRYHDDSCATILEYDIVWYLLSSLIYAGLSR
jgi:hypothetical protein